MVFLIQEARFPLPDNQRFGLRIHLCMIRTQRVVHDERWPPDSLTVRLAQSVYRALALEVPEAEPVVAPLQGDIEVHGELEFIGGNGGDAEDVHCHGYLEGLVGVWPRHNLAAIVLTIVDKDTRYLVRAIGTVHQAVTTLPE